MDAASFKTWWREPLVHFLLLGALLFGLSSWRSGASERGRGRAGRIVVTRARVEELEKAFQETWQRPPTPQELQALVGEEIRDEISVREAVAAGLDLKDPILRRRLRRKLELSAEESALASSPSEEELRAFLQAHPEASGLPPADASGRRPELSAVREAVEREWWAAKKKESREALFRGLLARYEVVVERPADIGGAPAPAVRKTP